MSFSNYFENVILDHIMGNSVYTFWQHWLYIGLALDVLDTSTGDDCGEFDKAGAAYTRVPTVAADWNNCAAGVTTNAQAITFPEATGDWGEASHFIICDTGVAFTGNLLMYGTFLGGRNKIIEEGSIPKFEIDALECNID